MSLYHCLDSSRLSSAVGLVHFPSGVFTTVTLPPSVHTNSSQISPGSHKPLPFSSGVDIEIKGEQSNNSYLNFLSRYPTSELALITFSFFLAILTSWTNKARWNAEPYFLAGRLGTDKSRSSVQLHKLHKRHLAQLHNSRKHIHKRRLALVCRGMHPLTWWRRRWWRRW